MDGRQLTREAEQGKVPGRIRLCPVLAGYPPEPRCRFFDPAGARWLPRSFVPSRPGVTVMLLASMPGNGNTLCAAVSTCRGLMRKPVLKVCERFWVQLHP